MASSIKIDQFIKLLYTLLPTGYAWNNDPDSDLYKLVNGIIIELCRVDDRLEDLLREIDPFQTLELLEDWETMLDLVDTCLDDENLSIDDRRSRIVQQLNALGGASADYFEELLLNSGFVVEVTPYFAPFKAGSRAGDRLTNGQSYFRAGSRAGDRLYNTGWTFWWEVHSDDNIVTYFVAGSRAGERLANYGNERIECIVEKLKPAHTNVLFTYGP